MSVPVLSRLSSARDTAEALWPSPRFAAKTRHRRRNSFGRPSAACRLVSQIPVLSPQSQSLFRRYGSILPTSLTYIHPFTRGFSPWRPDAVMGTIGREQAFEFPDFLGQAGVHQTPQPVRRSASFQDPLAERVNSRGLQLLKRKDNSSWSAGLRLWIRLRCR